jgi:diguanylate cyclase (GGDEF)-like protein
MVKLNSLTLAFRDTDLERAFYSYTHARTLQQGRIAIIVGVIVYVLYGMLDQWFVPPEYRERVWAIRLTALCVPATVFLLMLTRWFARVRHLSLALVGLAAGVGFLGMLLLIPLDSISLYYPGMVLVTFFTYNLSGTRFVYALCVDVVLLLSYNLIFAVWKGYPVHVMASHDFFIISANLVGGASGYLKEHQDRQLFLRDRELEAERQSHLNRSLHDRLTGLPNRELLHDRMTQALKHTHRDGSCHAGFFIDLDGFKPINDQFGHEIGDLALRAVAARLTDAVRDTDTVARLGGDEFFVLAHGIGSVDDAMKQADKMLALIKTANADIPGGRLSASIGICPFPYEGAAVDDIIRRADQAMYQAKKAGKDRYLVACATDHVDSQEALVGHAVNARHFDD